jgi:predicted oxidoreductase
MKTYSIPQTDLEVSRLGYGCMNIGGAWDRSPLTEDERAKAVRLVTAAFENGITLFDLADIYTHGKSEEVFGYALQQIPGLRDQIVLQSKCGIRFVDDPQPGVPQRYDFSYEHILQSVEDILKRLQTDRLDILLLHRPDPLVEPEDVARAFSELEQSGKVRYFGVSNHSAAQIELLKKFVEQPLVVNQLELNLIHSYLIEVGVMVNQTGQTFAAASGLLDYCRIHDIFVQAWSPVAVGKLFDLSGKAMEQAGRAAAAVARLAEEKGTTPEGIALAWILRHPAGIQPIIGTTKVERLLASCQADEVSLSREEWYLLFEAARGTPMS